MIVLKLLSVHEDVVEVNHCDDGVYIEIGEGEYKQSAIIHKEDVKELIKFLQNEPRLD